MNLPRLTAEAGVYRTGRAYWAVDAMHDNKTSVAPARSAARIDGLEAIRKYINGIDLTALKTKLTLPPSRGGHSWTPERADEAEAQYKKWLFLQRKHEDVLLAPGSEVDAVWHCYILDTRAYIRDTARIFGHYLHHYPYVGITEGLPTVAAVLERTRRLFRAEYGEELITQNAGTSSPALTKREN
jgi:hypothetical protein